MKTINVIDENGKSYSSTYVKRAKGLVKHNRAYWVGDDTICLRVPHEFKEDKMLTINDIERMISLTVAGNYAIRNKIGNIYNLSYEALKVLCDTYDSIIEELITAGFKINAGLDKINASEYANKANDDKAMKSLENVIFTKNCLLNPVLKLEKEKLINQQNKNLHPNVPKTNDCQSFVNLSKGNNNFNVNISDFLNEVESYKEELEELTDELEEKKDELESLQNELEELTSEKENVADEIDSINEEISNLEEAISSVDPEDEAVNELTEELNELKSDLEDLLNEQENHQDDIDELEEEISSLEAEIVALEQLISLSKEKINTIIKQAAK